MVPEKEILGQMRESFRLAAECATELAEAPARGPAYFTLVQQLGLIEGCCRQTCYYRDDSRWLPVGVAMAKVHEMAGRWLRQYPRTAESNEAYPLFMKMAETMQGLARVAEDLETKATGVAGLILPDYIKALPRSDAA